jgi:hypothetical protein
MPVIDRIPTEDNIRNNVHLRGLVEIIGPIAGRDSQDKTSDNTKIDLRRPIPAYTFGYIFRIGYP